VAASGLEFPEGVDETRSNDPVEPRPFLVGEARVTSVGSRVGQVEFLVGNIEIPAEDHRFLFFQVTHEFQELHVPFVFPVVQAGQLALRVGSVDGDQEKVVEFSGQHPALGVEFSQSQTGKNRLRNLAGQQGGAGISPFQRWVPEHRVTGQVDLDLLGQRAHFLQADHVRVAATSEVQNSFFDTGPQAVHVP